MKIINVFPRLFLWLCFLSGLVGQATPVFSVVEIDHGIYAGLLEKYVNHGNVDYQGLKNEELHLDRYLKILEHTDIRKLSDNEQFAFYINAYNAWTIKLILSAYPGIESIKELGNIFKSPWKKRIVKIDEDVVSLDHIEHDILRPRFKDPPGSFCHQLCLQRVPSPQTRTLSRKISGPTVG